MHAIPRFLCEGRSAAPAVVGIAVLAGCASAASITPAGASPTTRPTAVATPSVTATASPAAWVTVPHFVAGNETTYFASMVIPPSWQYVPANRTGNCGTAICYSGSSDTLQGPDGTIIAIGGPTAMGTGETCTDYARGETGGGYHFTGDVAVTVGGISTVEYTYMSQQGAVTYVQDIVPLESTLIGCASLHAIGVQSAMSAATIARIFTAIGFHPSN